jgi:hypothetical protein
MVPVPAVTLGHEMTLRIRIMNKKERIYVPDIVKLSFLNYIPQELSY